MAQEALRDEMKVLARIIKEVHSFAKENWKDSQNIHGDKLDPTTYEVYRRLIDKFPPIDSPELSNRLFESVKPRNLCLYLDGGGTVYLPPLDENHEFVATLSLECDLKAKTIGLRVELHTLMQEQLCGIAYRLEFGTQAHAYHHFTLANKRPDREGGTPIDGCPPWLPTKIPRIPVSGQNPVSILVGVLIALYGVRGYRTLLSKLDEPVNETYLHGLEHILSLS